jgi:hypothetical protein
MFRALAVKELRETRGIALLALAACGYLAAMTIDPRFPMGRGWWQDAIPFVDDRFFGWCGWISAALATALGLRQTLGESIRGTWPFLLHRPASRRWLIGVKLLVGAVVYLVCAVVPIVVVSLWAARPGAHASPFRWWMTLPSWEMWLTVPVLYLGAFLTGIRPGRWVGSRLLPLVAAGLVAIFTVAQISSEESSWWLLVPLVADALMIAGIFFIAHTRDF